MKILIMVLSYCEEPYLSLMRAQQETFCKDLDMDTKVIFYSGTENPPSNYTSIGFYNLKWNHIVFPITDAYYYMAGKFKLCLDHVFEETQYFKPDIIFRTNSSSYVNISELKKIAQSLPKEKLYAGWEIQTNEQFSIVSGAGFFLSPDTAKILQENIDPRFEKEEDYYCGQILHDHGIEVIDDKRRFDVPAEVIPEEIPMDRYHYRCKAGCPREQDAENMRIIHNLIINNR